ncbi:MAG TPA: hypothetical protein PLK69_04180 [Tetrasphaera sp.]|nr:hypothetical protein [Tetrasphaera sp.]
MSEPPELIADPVRAVAGGRHEPVGSWPTRATLVATVAGAALVALCDSAGALFVLLTVVLGIFVLIWGWPVVVGSPEPTGTRLAIAVTAAASVLSAYLADDGPLVRHLPAALAGGLIAGFLVQLGRGEATQAVVTALTSAASGIALVASGMALAALPGLRGADRPITLAMAGIALSVVADLLPERWRGGQLLLASVLGAVGGLIAVALVPGGAAYEVAALLGGSAALVAASARIALRELPGSRAAGGPAVLAAACLLAPGILTYTIARLLLG